MIIVPLTIVPGMIVPVIIVPGIIVPGMIVPGTIVPGIIVPGLPLSFFFIAMTSVIPVQKAARPVGEKFRELLHVPLFQG